MSALEEAGPQESGSLPGRENHLPTPNTSHTSLQMENPQCFPHITTQALSNQRTPGTSASIEGAARR